MLPPFFHFLQPSAETRLPVAGAGAPDAITQLSTTCLLASTDVQSTNSEFYQQDLIIFFHTSTTNLHVIHTESQSGTNHKHSPTYFYWDIFYAHHATISIFSFFPC
jgi:hypothetical protein